MEEILCIPFLIGFIILGLWLFLGFKEGVKSIGRTTEAVGEWNREQLEKREKRKRELEAELRKLQ